MARIARVVAAGIPHLLEIVGNWREFLLDGNVEKEINEIRRHVYTGRQASNPSTEKSIDLFIIYLEIYLTSGRLAKCKS
jgi:hypothetical protein